MNSIEKLKNVAQQLEPCLSLQPHHVLLSLVHVLAEMALPGTPHPQPCLNYVLMSHTQFVILCVNVYFFKVCFPHQFCQKGSGQLTFVGTESHVRGLLGWKVVNQSFQGLLTQVKNLGAGRVGLEHYWKLLSRKETYSKQPFENTDLRTDSVLSVLHQREQRQTTPHQTSQESLAVVGLGGSKSLY